MADQAASAIVVDRTKLWKSNRNYSAHLQSQAVLSRGVVIALVKVHLAWCSHNIDDELGLFLFTKRPCHIGLDSVLMRRTWYVIALHYWGAHPVSNFQVGRPRGIFLTGCSILTDYADMIAISSRELASINYNIGEATYTVSLAVESGSLRETVTRVYSTLSLRAWLTKFGRLSMPRPAISQDCTLQHVDSNSLLLRHWPSIL